MTPLEDYKLRFYIKPPPSHTPLVIDTTVWPFVPRVGERVCLLVDYYGEKHTLDGSVAKVDYMRNDGTNELTIEILVNGDLIRE